jgi:DASS family divalent anion:Na+ symporter
MRTFANAQWWRWAVVLGPAAVLFLFPISILTPQQNHLLMVFVATIVALVAQPVRMGVSVLIAITVLALTRILTPAQALSGFSNVTVWLVFTAFLFARAVTITGFGTRVGYLFIRRFARTPLSLSYSLAAADLVLAPFIPSDTARGGGIVFPVVRSVAVDFGSEPGPTSKLIGEFLVLVSYHTTYTASAIFLTGMAANPLIAEFAHKIGHVELTWTTWLTGSILPGLMSLTLVPLLIRKLAPPQIRDTTQARKLANAELERMGAMNGREKWLVAILLAVMAGWITSPWHGISNTFVALAGVSSLLLARVLEWDDLLAEHRAWDALVWFAGLVMMSDALVSGGVIGALSSRWFHVMAGWPWPVVIVALTVSYLYIHYSFASMTAHITALYPAFLAAALAGGVPPMIAALPLAYFSNLDAGITHYGTGSAPVFFGAGYVRQTDWWRIGFLISVMNLAIWLGVGMWWWKLVGLW